MRGVDLRSSHQVLWQVRWRNMCTKYRAVQVLLARMGRPVHPLSTSASGTTAEITTSHQVPPALQIVRTGPLLLRMHVATTRWCDNPTLPHVL